MRRLAAVAMLGVSVCLLLGAADGSWLRRVPDADRARLNPLPDKAAAAEAGAHVYAAECARCHGDQAQGRGNRPPLKSDRVAHATDGELAWLLKNGNSWKGMPSWSSMPDARRWQVVAYLRSMNPPVAPRRDPSQGEQK